MPDTQTVAARKPWLDPAQKPFVRIQKVTKKFGDFTAVWDVSLDIFKGELFCLLGGSGSGKSTLLRMIAGFEAPTSGRIEIDGQDMTHVAPYDRPTNMMFQSYALFPHMTVERNVAYGLLREGMARDKAMERVAAMLKLVQLTPFAGRKPHQLSGGQRQRVALARALVKRPKLLLLDEPLGALDKKLREETQFELVKIQETLGITFMVVTHDQEEAMTLSSRIGVMNEGEIVQVGEPNEIYEFPHSRFVADFVGSVNIFEGRVIEDEPDFIRLASPEAGCDIHVGHGVACTLNQTLWYAVRPEKMRLSRTDPGGAFNRVQGVVQEIAYLGNLSIFRVRLDSGKVVRATRANVARVDEEAISWDERVWVSWTDTAGVVLNR
ncbi:MAG: ABC transporter ATP-binding protein [Rhodobacteraceae bacterium]|jgi:putrescine transport system ATP-binding protein|nr:ABC transporter ATP-binding protein [Paracoccaceae bacterium]